MVLAALGVGSRQTFFTDGGSCAIIVRSAVIEAVWTNIGDHSTRDDIGGREESMHLRLAFRSAATMPMAIILASVTIACTGQSTPKGASRSANVQAGTITSVDPSAGTLVLKPKAGPDVTYHLTDKTHLLKEKKTVEATAFKTGDSVVVRFRKSTAGPASLYDVADKASWEWLNRLRHETMAVTVVEVSDETLKAVEGADMAEVDYRVTEKTSWQKAGKPAGAADFKAGDKVFVVPRLLPGGNVMATAVADSSAGAAVLKERAKTTVSGTVKAIDHTKRLLQIRSAAGDDRDLVLAPDVVVRLGSKDVPITSVHSGQPVSVHLSRNSENDVVASRITIQTRKTGARKPSKTAKPVVRAPVKP